MSQDFYRVLGVSKAASEQELKKAYRKLALESHPDKHKGDKAAEKRFQEVNEAYQTLSDPKKRAMYDQYGSVPPSGGFGGGGADFGQDFDFSQFGGGFGDIFESFFGGGFNSGGATGRRKKKGPRRGEDVEVSLRISFEEAAFGMEKDLILEAMQGCEHCTSTGAEPGSTVVDCKTCQGAGEIRGVRQTMLGQMMTSRVCETCQGEGRYPEKKCSKCHGAGRIRRRTEITLKIPAGIHDGATLRMSGKGEAGVFGGEAGDLFLHIAVAAHKKFMREGSDVHSEEHIHVLQAILGDTIPVETLHGRVDLKVPAGTPYGRVFRLKDSGIQNLGRSSRGDHFVKILISIPEKLSKKEEEFYQSLAQEVKTKKKDGFFGKLFS
ncbi:MAG: molecular chaperone DnaJ [Patescibacteria group bacterium]